MNMYHKIIAISLLLFFSHPTAAAHEVITSFHSDIMVQKDSTITVKETISVISAGMKIKRGIFREFPTHYTNRYGNNHIIKFKLDTVLCDTMAIPYHIEDRSNGIRIYIGHKDVHLSPGQHTFVIKYTVNRQIGFFEKFDELYWNVTGNGWIFPISQASATIYLPSQVPAPLLNTSVYTGYSGSTNTAAQASLTPNGAYFLTTEPLLPAQGLTIALSWPKGIITQPVASTHYLWFVQDNIMLMLALLMMIALLIGFAIFTARHRATKKHPAIIARFHPPHGMLPSAVNYFVSKGMSKVTLAAEIVNMACHGLLTIAYEKSFFTAKYTLHKVADADLAAPYPLHETLYRILFPADKSSIVIASEKSTMRLVGESLTANLQSFLDSKYFGTKHYSAVISAIATTAALAGCIFIEPANTLFFVPLIIFSLLMHLLFGFMLRGYTDEGDALNAEILGFKLFLVTTELDRIEIIGSPPDKTPELYEKYLPYAMALGVEKAWSAQFAPLFRDDPQHGGHYYPLWYHGGNLQDLQSGAFCQAISSSIASAATPPGSSSGSGGRGSSGGGGGGGGGGGW